MSYANCKETTYGRNRVQRTSFDTASAFGDAATADHPAILDHPTRIADPRRIAVAGEEVRPGATKPAAPARLPNGLPAELTKALVSLWTRYAGRAPSDARTEVRGNVVTCVLVEAVSDYNKRTGAGQAQGTAGGGREPTPQSYERDAVALVTRLTRQRVARFVSSHDRDTDVATEVFTLEPSFNRGAPRHAGGRSARDFRVYPTGVA